jgi:hypothetical protein
VRIPTNNDKSASPQPRDRSPRNGRKCPRCKRFGTFAPNAIICDRCLGTLPLVFDVTITVIVGGDE